MYFCIHNIYLCMYRRGHIKFMLINFDAKLVKKKYDECSLQHSNQPNVIYYCVSVYIYSQILHIRQQKLSQNTHKITFRYLHTYYILYRPDPTTTLKNGNFCMSLCFAYK